MCVQYIHTKHTHKNTGTKQIIVINLLRYKMRREFKKGEKCGRSTDDELTMF